MAQSIFSTATPNPDIPGVHEVEANEVLEKLGSFKLVDVRGEDEYRGPLGHIKGSELIVLNTLPGHIDDLPKHAPIVFVCLVGGRSARAAAFAAAHGCEQVYNLSGGMQRWSELGLPVER